MDRLLAASCGVLVSAAILSNASAADAVKGSRFVYDDVFVDVVPNPNEHLVAFNADGRENGLSGTLAACQLLLKARMGAHGANGVYAGVCTLVSSSEKRLVEVCDASMTNAFVVRALSSEQETPEELAEFMQNCGG